VLSHGHYDHFPPGHDPRPRVVLRADARCGDGVIENAGEGTDTFFSTVHVRLSANVEHLVLQGSADLQGYGNASADTLR
jgi:hypothetical protein